MSDIIFFVEIICVYGVILIDVVVIKVKNFFEQEGCDDL